MDDLVEPKANEIPAPGPYVFTTSYEIGKIAEALSKAQGAMQAAEFDRENPGFHFRYATIASIWEAIRGPLSANELAVTQIVSNGDLVTMLIHSSGQWFRSVAKILAKDQSAQGWGSGLTYSRRYCLQAIVGAASADEDDDGEEASKPKSIAKKESAPKRAVDRHPDSDHICPIHKVSFKVFEKDGRPWYSHKAGDTWCNETAAKAQVEPEPEQPQKPVFAKGVLEHLMTLDDRLLEAAMERLSPAQLAMLKAKLAGAKLPGADPGQAILDEAFGEATIPTEKVQSGEELNAECNAILALREKAGIDATAFVAKCQELYKVGDLWKMAPTQRRVIRKRLEKTLEQQEADKAATEQAG